MGVRAQGWDKFWLVRSYKFLSPFTAVLSEMQFLLEGGFVPQEVRVHQHLRNIRSGNGLCYMM